MKKIIKIEIEIPYITLFLFIFSKLLSSVSWAFIAILLIWINDSREMIAMKSNQTIASFIKAV